MDLVKSCLLLLLLLLSGAISQEKLDEQRAVVQNEKRQGENQPYGKLGWADFKGAPPGSKRVAATTASGISYSYTTTGSKGVYKLDYKVTAYFYPWQSWYHRELCDSVVLSHEQLHFDISELYARRMREMLGFSRSSTGNSPNSRTGMTGKRTFPGTGRPRHIGTPILRGGLQTQNETEILVRPGR